MRKKSKFGLAWLSDKVNNQTMVIFQILVETIDDIDQIIESISIMDSKTNSCFYKASFRHHGAPRAPWRYRTNS